VLVLLRLLRCLLLLAALWLLVLLRVAILLALLMKTRVPAEEVVHPAAPPVPLSPLPQVPDIARIQLPVASSDVGQLQPRSGRQVRQDQVLK
jgi:hypothetical protein